MTRERLYTDDYKEVTCDWNYDASSVSPTGCLTLSYAFVAITLVCFSDRFDVYFVCMSSWCKEDLCICLYLLVICSLADVEGLWVVLLCSIHDDSGCILDCSIWESCRWINCHTCIFCYLMLLLCMSAEVPWSPAAQFPLCGSQRLWLLWSVIFCLFISSAFTVPVSSCFKIP